MGLKFKEESLIIDVESLRLKVELKLN